MARTGAGPAGSTCCQVALGGTASERSRGTLYGAVALGLARTSTTSTHLRHVTDSPAGPGHAPRHCPLPPLGQLALLRWALWEPGALAPCRQRMEFSPSLEESQPHTGCVQAAAPPAHVWGTRVRSPAVTLHCYFLGQPLG